MTKCKQLLSLILFLACGIIYSAKATSVKGSTFGWNASNATAAFVNAINSANDTIIIDKQGSDWMINPTFFYTLKNKTIIFENDVNLVARPGAFNSIYDASLLTFYEANNLKIIGYGATFKMQKAEYIAYNNSEHRHCIQLISCNNIAIYGLKLMDSGGDGIIVASYTSSMSQRYSENVLLKDLWCDNNYRQGISVISAQHLRVENCWFTNTKGTAPQAGVDIEPNKPFERLVDIVFDNCRFTGNAGSGILLAPISIDSTTIPMDITFNNCYVSNNGVNRYQISTYSYASGAKGNVNFNHCMTEGGGYSVGGTKLASGYKANFNNCVFLNPTNIVINLDDHTTSSSKIRNGGMSFNNCMASYNSTYRYFNVWRTNTTSIGVSDVQFKNFTVINPNNVTFNNSGNVSSNCIFDFQKFNNAPVSNLKIDVSDKMVECNNSDALLKLTRDPNSNISYPLGIIYSLKGTGVQGVDYSRPVYFEIIPKGEMAISDTIRVLSDDISEQSKYDSLILNASTDFTTSYLPEKINIDDFVIPNLAVNSETICSGQSTTVIATGADNYIWSNNETGSSINISPTMTTNYTVSGNFTGCPSTIVYTQVIVKPIPTISVTSDTICTGQTAILTASGATEYQWSNNEIGNSIAISPTETTNYSVSGSTDGCTSIPLSTQVTVRPLPILTIMGDIVCLGQIATLTANGATAYLWSTSETTSSIEVVTEKDTEFTVTGTIDGCSTSSSAFVSVFPLPSINLGNDIILLQGKDTILDAAGTGMTYLWSTGATTQSIVVNEMGTYSVTVTDDHNCSASDTISVTLFSSNNDLEVSKIELIPNPISDYVQVKSNIAIDSYQIINLVGKVIISSNLLTDVGNHVLDFSLLPSGTYFVKVVGNKLMKTVRVVKI